MSIHSRNQFGSVITQITSESRAYELTSASLLVWASHSDRCGLRRASDYALENNGRKTFFFWVQYIQKVEKICLMARVSQSILDGHNSTLLRNYPEEMVDGVNNNNSTRCVVGEHGRIAVFIVSYFVQHCGWGTMWRGEIVFIHGSFYEYLLKLLNFVYTK